MSDTPLGRFCWYDLMTTDVDAAQAFYRDVAGWGIEMFDTDKGGYPMWSVDGTAMGGVMKLPDEAAQAGAPPHWMAYVSTPDIEATLEKTKELGGSKAMGPMDIPTVGRFAVIRDPQGAMIALFEPQGTMPGNDEPARVGNFSWHELATQGWEDAWAFYSELFGWSAVETVDMGELGKYHMFNTGAHPVGGMFDRPASMPVSSWVYYVRAADLDAALERVKAGGGQVLNGPMVVPGGDRVAQCMDPQGAMFALHWSGMS